MLVVVVTACGGSDKPVPLLWVSKGGVSSPASLLSNTFLVDATVNGRSTAKVILDTGAPFSFLNRDVFDGLVPDGLGSVDSLTIGDVTLVHVPTVGRSGAGIGLVGFTAFGQFDFSLNYRDQIVSFGAGPAPAGLQPDGVTIPFTLQGGGPVAVGDSILKTPPSRVVISVEIEGETHDVLVDSGASVVGLRKSVFDALGGDGRGHIEEQFELAAGVSTASLMRLRSVVVGGMEVVEPPAASSTADPVAKVPGMDTLLDSLSEEVGRPIDGLLGGAVLREFYVTIGYPEGQLSLDRYTSRAHIRDDYRRVGFALGSPSERPPFKYVIHRIYAGTDAARQLAAHGLREGDDVLSVNGKALPSDDPLAPIAADAMLLGTVGQTLSITFDSATLEILVEDLIPLP